MHYQDSQPVVSSAIASKEDGFPSSCGFDQETEALLTLALTPGLGPVLIQRLFSTFGSARESLSQDAKAWQQVRGISAAGASRLLKAARSCTRAKQPQQEWQRACDAGMQIIGIHHPSYPKPLKLIPDPPPLLWVQGQLHESDALAVSIVGARECSAYGREQSDRFAAGLAAAGLCVVSGGAYGIDTAAHQAVVRLRGGMQAAGVQSTGRTMAVIGSGLAKPYPAPNKALFEQIVADEHGAVISELPMLTPPAAEHFPRRNRIISGLSMGVVVIEAALRSGALITARQCVEEHGRELMVLPGRVDAPQSAGCHKVLRQGWGTLVTSVSDVLDQLGEAGQVLKAAQVSEVASVSKSEPALTVSKGPADNLAEVVMALLAHPRSIDELLSQLQTDAAVLQRTLTVLEIQGRVRRQQGLFARR